MTTEHVSVPREYVEQLQRALLGMGLREDSETLRELLSNSTQSTGHDPCTDECSENPEVRQAYANGYDVGYAHGNAILSRATPIDVCDFCGGDCSSANPPVATCPLITQGIDAAIDTVRKVDEATPSAPRVVTDEDVERACKARFPETWGMMAENLKVIYRATSRRMLESFATSLPADVNDHETDPE